MTHECPACAAASDGAHELARHLIDAHTDGFQCWCGFWSDRDGLIMHLIDKNLTEHYLRYALGLEKRWGHQATSASTVASTAMPGQSFSINTPMWQITQPRKEVP